MKRLSRSRIYIYLIFAIIIAGLHGHVLDNFWLFDDLQILRHAEKYKPWEYFLIPEVWQELSISNFTPLVTLSFDIDFALFGFDPKWFYLHHLVSLWFVSIMLYFVLKLWVPHIFAMFGVLLFLVSAPVGIASEFLMIRHYIEGSALILLSFFLFATALRRDSFALACVAALPYFFAMSGKEIYVPLAIIVLFIPEKKWLSRLKYAAPLFGAMLIYFAWRYMMLGRTVGGYHDNIFGADILSEVYRIVIKNPLESIKMVLGSPAFASFANVIVFVCIGIFLSGSILLCIHRRKPSVLIFFAILLSMVYAPISFSFLYLDAADFGTYRWVYFVSLFYSSLVALTAYHLFESAKTSVRPAFSCVRCVLPWLIPSSCILVLVVLFLSAFHWLAIQRKTVIKPLCREGFFLMNQDERSVLVKSFVFPFNNYYEHLGYFRKLYSNTPLPGVVYETYAFIDERNPLPLYGRKVYKYSSTTDTMADITQDFLLKRSEYLSRVRKLPLQVALMVKNKRLNFSFGPSDNGRYFLMTGFLPGMYLTSIDIPRHLTNNIYIGQTKWYVRFGWESPEGWITFSPEWFLDFSKDQEIFWKQ